MIWWTIGFFVLSIIFMMSGSFILEIYKQFETNKDIHSNLYKGSKQRTLGVALMVAALVSFLCLISFNTMISNHKWITIGVNFFTLISITCNIVNYILSVKYIEFKHYDLIRKIAKNNIIIALVIFVLGIVYTTFA